MGRSMYQYGKQTKEKDRQLKQIAKQLKRSSAKQQQTELKEDVLPAGKAIPERNEDE